MANNKLSISEEFILTLVQRILPTVISIAVLLIYSNQQNQPVTYQNFALATIIGISISLWLMVWKERRNNDDILNILEREHSFNITVLSNKNEIEKACKNIYKTKKAVIYSTSINYTPDDIEISDSRKADWASFLYAKNNCKVVYNRIISITDDNDKDWVKKMQSANKNKNYDVRIIEDYSKNILFPNFVIAKSHKESKIFISYRATAAEGRFAFYTENTEFVNGIIDYFSLFHSSLPKLSDCILKW